MEWPTYDQLPLVLEGENPEYRRKNQLLGFAQLHGIPWLIPLLNQSMANQDIYALNTAFLDMAHNTEASSTGVLQISLGSFFQQWDQFQAVPKKGLSDPYRCIWQMVYPDLHHKVSFHNLITWRQSPNDRDLFCLGASMTGHVARRANTGTWPPRLMIRV